LGALSACVMRKRVHGWPSSTWTVRVEVHVRQRDCEATPIPAEFYEAVGRVTGP